MHGVHMIKVKMQREQHFFSLMTLAHVQGGPKK